MANFLEDQMKNIQKILMNSYETGKNQPNSIKGMDREIFIGRFLRKILPKSVNISSGMIIDRDENVTGQLDLIIGHSNSFSIPNLISDNRIYLSESVISMIEVKSNLQTQWKQMKNTIKKVKNLSAHFTRMRINGEDFFTRIPCYAVGYTGFSNILNLQEYLQKTDENERPDGVLIIDKSLYIGKKNNSNIFCPNSDSPRGLISFILAIWEDINNFNFNKPNIESYLSGKKYVFTQKKE